MNPCLCFLFSRTGHDAVRLLLLEQFVLFKCIPPDYILVLVEIPIKDLAYLVPVDVIRVDQFY